MNYQNLYFQLPGGARGYMMLDLSEATVLPGNIKEEDIAAFLQADLPVTIRQLTGTVQISEHSFVAECKTGYYHLRWAVDFRTSTVVILKLNVAKSNQQKGIGLRLFAHIVEWCRRIGLKEIELYAEGGLIGAEQKQWRHYKKNSIRQTPEQIGYYTWGRFGFGMSPYYAAIFESWNGYFRCSDPRFPELMINEADRLKWKKVGFSWRGKFNVNPESSSSKNWERYHSERSLAHS